MDAVKRNIAGACRDLQCVFSGCAACDVSRRSDDLHVVEGEAAVHRDVAGVAFDCERLICRLGQIDQNALMTGPQQVVHPCPLVDGLNRKRAVLYGNVVMNLFRFGDGDGTGSVGRRQNLHFRFMRIQTKIGERFGDRIGFGFHFHGFEASSHEQSSDKDQQSRCKQYDCCDNGSLFHFVFSFPTNSLLMPCTIFFASFAVPTVAALHAKNRKIETPVRNSPAPSSTMPNAT